jgi:hypothetical protein
MSECPNGGKCIELAEEVAALRAELDAERSAGMNDWRTRCLAAEAERDEWEKLTNAAVEREQKWRAELDKLQAKYEIVLRESTEATMQVERMRPTLERAMKIISHIAANGSIGEANGSPANRSYVMRCRKIVDEYRAASSEQ